ncbi:hypothetical protein GOP47_0026974 [Adiantum capillus-veneris]|nr:hypothetical protein GOP47_0026974 [Adiantum capillus-veneris]
MGLSDLAQNISFQGPSFSKTATCLHFSKSLPGLHCSLPAGAFASSTASHSRSLCYPPFFLASSRSHVAFTARRCPPLYDDFIEFAIREVGQSTCLSPFPLQEGLKEVLAEDGKTTLCSNAFQSSKMRLFRIASLDGGENMQVLNLAIFPNLEYDLPIFCADFFSTSTKHIIVLDLNPLYDAEKNKWYKEKYYKGLIPMVNKYTEVLPWGQQLTTESLQFFSPIVIWTKLESRQDVQEKLFSAFKDYIQVWLKMMEGAEATSDSAEVLRNQQAQHRYLLWRATKDPGRPLLHRLFGQAWCEMYIHDFLFNGVTTLGAEKFLDYFPEYSCADGSIRKERSVVGKSCIHRPWDEHGNFTMSL